MGRDSHARRRKSLVCGRSDRHLLPHPLSDNAPFVNCIFCGTATSQEPREHIVPEGLVGHQPFEIKFGSIVAAPKRLLLLDHDEVCRRCNNRLGMLDQYLLQQLGFLRTYWNPIGTKSGKAATAQRRGMYAVARSEGPHIVLNMESHAIVTPEGVRINPADKDELAVRVKDFKVNGRIATMTIQQPVRMNKRFMRALHKIAFELLCFQKGPELVLDPAYDPVRSYILRGQGNREMVLTRSAEAGGWEQPYFGLQHELAWPGWLATLRLASTFYIDLSPANTFFEKASQGQLTASNMIKWCDRNRGQASDN